jgi:tetratricopeptide (TPR) repeat protein
VTRAFAFKDHYNELFGRQPDIDFLMAQCLKKGITAIAARPQMGKTWLLEQLGWELESRSDCILGYAESTGEKDDLLLRAIEDLYKRWLTDASMKEQLHSIFVRHKNKLIRGAGGTIGSLFKSLIPGGAMVETAMKGLASADGDLKTGGIELPSLDYESALSLAQLISEETKGKNIILMLDAWEKSPSIEKIYHILSRYLSRIDNWPNCHILIGIRDPEFQRSGSHDQAYSFIQDLCESNPAAAKLWRLPPMHLASSTEKDRMLAYLKTIIPAAPQMSDDDVFQIIDQFPGVIYRFRNPEELEQVKSMAGLQKLAHDAQSYRYREFKKLLPSLKGDELALAIRLAVFHRLNEDSWSIFNEVLCEGLDLCAWEILRLNRILEPASYPTYGHDTRHQSALRNFLETRPDSVAQHLESIIYGLAEKVKRIDETTRPYSEALSGLWDKTKNIHVHETARALCLCAMIVYPGTYIKEYSLIDKAFEIRPTCKFSNFFLVFSAMMNRGARKNQAGDADGAIEDFTALIGMTNVPADQLAYALYNRGVIKSQVGDAGGAMADYTAVIEMIDAPPAPRAQALFNRGVIKSQAGDADSAIANYTGLIEMIDAPAGQRAQALNNRGVIKGQAGDRDGAMTDLTSVIEMADVPAHLKDVAQRGLDLLKGI